MPGIVNTQTITKFDAARRQLDTAIELFAREGDTVSIHALACAAYDVIHTVSKKQGRTRTLMFDSKIADKEQVKKYNIHLKKAANFFKHAEHDSNETIDFDPVISETFIVFSLFGLLSMGAEANRFEHAFMVWYSVHRPNHFSSQRDEILHHFFTVEQLKEMLSLSRTEFFEAVLNSHDALGTIEI